MARFMVSMPDDMVKQLDRRALEEHRSRSELLREAARRHLASSVSEGHRGTANARFKRQPKETETVDQEIPRTPPLGKRLSPEGLPWARCSDRPHKRARSYEASFADH